MAPRARAIEPWTPPEWPPEASEHALGPVADEDLPALMSLRQRDPVVRREAALEIGRSRKPALLGYLVSMLDDPEATVRAAAVTAIGAIPDARIGRPLGRALLDESEEVRSTARAALRAAGISEADAKAEAKDSARTVHEARRPSRQRASPASSGRSVIRGGRFDTTR